LVAEGRWEGWDAETLPRGVGLTLGGGEKKRKNPEKTGLVL
jgi:hypothetical protein